MICLILSVRGPLPLLIYSEGTRLQVKYPIWYNYNIMSCSARLHLAGWATSGGAAHVTHEGIGGLFPHTVQPAIGAPLAWGGGGGC